MSYKKNNKLTAALIFSVLLAIAVPVSITWYFTVSSQERDIDKSLTVNRDQTLNMLSVSLASPLWDLRQDKINSICTQFLSNSYIKKIRVFDSILDKVVFDGTNSASTGMRVISGTKSVIANKKTVGGVYIEVSSVNYDRSVTDSKRLLLFLFIMELVISFFLVTYAVYHFVLFPLHKRTEMVLALYGHGEAAKRNFFDMSIEKLNAKIVGILDEFERYHKIVDENVAIIKIDKDGTIMHTTSAVTDLSGYSEEELIWCNISKLTGSKDVHAVLELIDADDPSAPFCFPLKCSHAFGSEYWLSCKISIEQDGTTTLVCEDITPKKEVEKLANTDELTGLMNRRSINKVLEKEEQLYTRYRTPYSIFMIDIDFFKRINDTFGHQAGDVILSDFADIVSKNIRETDYAARWGGEEFLLVCPNTSAENAQILAEHILKIISEFDFPFVSRLTCSIGFCSASEGKTSEKMLRDADTALYKAKESGRNRFVKA